MIMYIIPFSWATNTTQESVCNTTATMTLQNHSQNWWGCTPRTSFRS